MKNKKIKYKDLCQTVQEQKDQIKELEKQLWISYLKNGKVNTITYTLQGDYLPFPKIKEIVKQSDTTYIITVQRTKDYYEYYGVDTSTWTIFDATSLVKSNDKLTSTVVKTQNFIN